MDREQADGATFLAAMRARWLREQARALLASSHARQQRAHELAEQAGTLRAEAEESLRRARAALAAARRDRST
jgi:hypothetical protein